ncbi:PREDICTED: uncharacterized protein LOC102018488 [Chinchilla lanigera]|uniref:uncharacterized protein LOC102018488 n=1 Tax=Chinchilla lanigera TaxID=34839 RepID=UPI00038EC948|nr:PREDICTED: uncharacterized protein LOC102018488 [Chinchilla lanigera]
MAVGFGDPTSGFRYTEVIRLINNEILMNGGGQDFYLTFRSRSWNEIEDGLHNILSDPHMPRNHKKACAWSALALAVRVVARQREQHIRQVRRLKEQLRGREALSWALASELQQVRQQRDQATTQLQLARSALHQAQSECDMLRMRLFQSERCAQVALLAQDIVPEPRGEQFGAAAWPLNAEQQRDVWAVGEHDRSLFETPVPAPNNTIYMPDFWAPIMPPPHPVLVPQFLPLQAPLPMGLPPLLLPTPAVVTETGTGGPFQRPPVGIYPPIQSAIGGFQEEMVPLWDQSCYSQVEGPVMLQGSVLQGDRSLSQEDLQRPQGMPLLEERGNSGQEEDQQRPLGMIPLGDGRNHNQEEGLLWPQGMYFLGENQQYSQEQDQERPQGTASLGDSRKYSQEDHQEGAQGKAPPGFRGIHSQAENVEKAELCTTYLGISRSHSKAKGTKCIKSMTSPGTRSPIQECVEKAQVVISTELSGIQEEDQDRPQCMILPSLRSHKQEENVERTKDTARWKSWSQAVKESPKKQQPQQQKVKETKEKKALESQQQKKSVSCYSPVNWVCAWCKVMNFPWHMACYKCKKVRRPEETGDVDPGQTH